MTTNTADQAITIPVTGDPATIPAHISTFIGQIESRLVKRYVNEADRTARNPTPVAGEVSYLTTPGRHDFWSGSDWWEQRELFARKTAEAQVANNTTAFVTDTHLVLPVRANAIYRLSGQLFWDSGTTSDIKYDWIGPAGFTVPIWGIIAQNTALTTNYSVSTAAATPLLRGGEGIGSFVAGNVQGLIVTAGTAGNVNLRWSQNALEAVNTRLKIPSWVSLLRVG